MALAFLIPNERKYLCLFLASLVWLILVPWNGAERQHWCEEGTWEAQSIHLRQHRVCCCFFFNVTIEMDKSCY